MAYGVDANGNPITTSSDTQTRTGPNGQNQCQSGYHWDDSQGCVGDSQTQNVTTQQQPAGQPQQQQPASQTQTQQPASNPLYQGMNPQLVSLFQQYNQTPTGQGTGNTDIAYWNNLMSQPGADVNYYLGRLKSDFQGNGPDTGGPNQSGGPNSQFSIQNYLSGMPQSNFQLSAAPNGSPINYQPTQYTQNAPFQAGPVQGQMGGLIGQLLASGGSMGPQQVAQLMGQQQDTITSSADQAKQNILGSAAMRGTSGGGSTAAQLGNVDLATMGNMSAAQRNIGAQAAQTNFNDQLNALGAGSNYQNQLLDQYLQQAGLNLSTQQAQAGENQFGALFGSQQQQNQFNNWLQGQNLAMTASQLPLQNYLAAMGLNLNYNQLGENARQYNLGNQMQMAQFLYS